MTRTRSKPRLAFVGAGRLAGALAARLAQRGWPAVAVASRRRGAAQKLASTLTALHGGSGRIQAGTSARSAASRADWILLAVPDRSIESVAGNLADGSLDWDDRVVLHHAGALGIEPLACLQQRGAAVGVLHPLQSFGAGVDSARWVDGSHARIEGDPAAVKAAGRIARVVGLKPLALPPELDPAGRQAYHAAASLAANDLLALVSTAMKLMTEAGFQPDESRQGLVRLIQGTLEQASSRGIDRALTGPAVRGDFETVARQVLQIGRLDPTMARAHRDMAATLAALAEASGQSLPKGFRKRLLALNPPPAGRRGKPPV